METAHRGNFDMFDYEDGERNRVLAGKGCVVQEGVTVFVYF